MRVLLSLLLCLIACSGSKGSVHSVDAQWTDSIADHNPVSRVETAEALLDEFSAKEDVSAVPAEAAEPLEAQELVPGDTSDLQRDMAPDLLADTAAYVDIQGVESGEPVQDAMLDISQEAVLDTSSPDVGSGPKTATVFIESPSDALASYLMDASVGAWNIFGGASVPLGRHFDLAHVSYHTALRFPNIPVPPGAKIVSAELAWWPTNEVDSSSAIMLEIRGEKAANSAPFSLNSYDSGRPDQRLATIAGYDHWVVRCNADCSEEISSPKWEYDCAQRKLDCWNREVRYKCPKDLAPILQEVVDMEGWEAGNAFTVLLTNVATDQDGPKYKGSRTITGYDPERGLDYRPCLTITWDEM